MTAPKTSGKPNWFMQTLGSTIGRKLLMALTGLFLILFLTVHLIGNLQLLLPDGGKTFNQYSEFMGHNEIIQIISIGNFFFILLHIIVAFILYFQNKGARPAQYASQSKTKTSLAARQMMTLGTFILIFIIIHLVQFWGKMKLTKWGMGDYVPHINIDGKETLNLYLTTKAAFAEIWIVGLYTICMVALAFHLSHGFQSAFQSLGLNHKKYTPFIKTLGFAYSILVPFLFALIPIVMFVQQMK